MKRFQAHLGDQTFDLTLDDETLLLNGEAIPYTFKPLGPNQYVIALDNQHTRLVIEEQPDGKIRVTAHGRQAEVVVKDETALLLEQFGLDTTDGAADLEIHAPMPGLVLQIRVAIGQSIKKGDGVMVLEAMKMENELRAACDGTVRAIHVTEGTTVGKNALLIELDP